MTIANGYLLVKMLAMPDPERVNSLGPWIKDRRQAKGLKQREFAEMVGTSPAYMSQIEAGGTKVPQPDLRRKIANALGVSHIELLIAAGELTPDEIERAGTRGVVADNPDDPRVQIHALVDQVNWWGRLDRIDGITSQLERWAESDRFIKEVF